MVDSPHTIHVDVVSAEESIFSGEARFVALPQVFGWKPRQHAGRGFGAGEEFARLMRN